jgi:hypothetical protein
VRRLGVHRQPVIRWARQLAESSRAGLKQAHQYGRKPKLSANQLRKIAQTLKCGPEVLGCAASGAHGSRRTGPDAAISCQLEGALGGRRHHVVEILSSVLVIDHPRSAGGGLSGALAASSAGPTVGNLRSLQDSSQPPGRGICRGPARPSGAGLPTALCSGTQSGRVHIGSLETSRAA